MSSEVKITLIKSQIGKPAKQRSVLKGLGLTKLHKTVVLKDTPEIRGMISKVNFMLKVEE
jgi:large subunit ribosomal protein L30